MAQQRRTRDIAESELKAAKIDRANAAEEAQKLIDKKERKRAHDEWLRLASLVHQLEDEVKRLPPSRLP